MNGRWFPYRLAGGGSLVASCALMAGALAVTALPAVAAAGAVRPAMASHAGGASLKALTERQASAAFVPPLPKGVVYDPERAASSRGDLGARDSTASTPASSLPAAVGDDATLHPHVSGPLPSLAGPASAATRGLPSMAVPASDIWINSISCFSASFCMAVGQFDDYGTTMTYSARWNGSSWSTVAVPQYVSRSEVRLQQLLGVSCWSADACTAVGYALDLDDDNALTVFWNGSKWTLDVPTLTSNNTPTLSSVSCVGNGACVAVGTDAGQPFAMGWNTLSWSEIDVPPLTDGGALYGISCVEGPGCIAVGASNNPNDAFIAYTNGASWSQLSSDSPGSSDNVLYGVSCVSGAFCMAVGTQRSNGSSTPLYETIANDTAASSDGTGTDPYSDFARLDSVSCTKSSSCLAVGYGSSVGAYTEGTFAESWNGSKWTTVTSSSPGGSDASDYLAAVSCVAATDCQAG
ncbi:MAG TPA: hypothetical protein VGP46_10185, partial [Acidimicrobiales bacterium]|nr:hypothetical protein [Acidimicrobiales bacterium]